MVNNLKIAILIGLTAAIFLYPELSRGTTNTKEFIQGFIIYLILFTIIGFMAALFIGMI
jgi:hypothetical protein